MSFVILVASCLHLPTRTSGLYIGTYYRHISWTEQRFTSGILEGPCPAFFLLLIIIPHLPELILSRVSSFCTNKHLSPSWHALETLYGAPRGPAGAGAGGAAGGGAGRGPG